MKKSRKRPTNQDTDSKSYLQYTGLAIQMVGSILLMAFAGRWIDEHWKFEKPWFTLGLSLIAVFVILYKLVKNLMN